MRVTVTIQATVKSDLYGELEGFLSENLSNVRGFSGALAVSILFNQETKEFLIHEEWASQSHHQAYIQAITQNGVLAQLASFFEDAPVINYYVKQDI